uniref:Secreted protein n=1 Tax=Steinernema glaseri TaxID=37863 RepID=A0A1I7ZPR3_9BILA
MKGSALLVFCNVTALTPRKPSDIYVVTHVINVGHAKVNIDALLMDSIQNILEDESILGQINGFNRFKWIQSL